MQHFCAPSYRWFWWPSAAGPARGSRGRTGQLWCPQEPLSSPAPQSSSSFHRTTQGFYFLFADSIPPRSGDLQCKELNRIARWTTCYLSATLKRDLIKIRYPKKQYYLKTQNQIHMFYFSLPGVPPRVTSTLTFKESPGTFAALFASQLVKVRLKSPCLLAG